MSQICSKSSGVGVILEPHPKPKQNPAKSWCFTLNNYTEEDICSIKCIKDICEKLVVGKEMGKNGTPHLQGYFKLYEKKRAFSLGLSKRIHWEVARCSPLQNLAYCSKEGDVIISKGFPQPVKVLKDNQLYKWQKELCDILQDEPDDRSIYWYWSSNGAVGKTTFCKYLTVKYGAIALHGKGADVRNGIVQYKENNAKGETPRIVLFPVPRSQSAEYVSYAALENVKDMYFYSGKYEGGMICGNCPHLVVFANEPPDESKCSPDRWRIICIDDE